MPKDSHAAFVKALIFGFAGAILGLILYAAFGIITGLMIGYVSLAVGYIVGKAMLMGSGGLGGRRYQIAAVLFTYFAVSLAAIPLGISQYMKDQKQRHHGVVRSSSPTATSPQQENVASDSSQTDAVPDNPRPASPKAKPGVGAVLTGLLFLGLASPFLELSNPVSGIIGLIILLVGIQIAWKLTAGKTVEILGPFGESVPPPPIG
jgi:predicted outer membrane lipoprotein